MDELQTLDALAKVLNDISTRPYDIKLHMQHIRLAQSAEGMEAQLKSALELMTEFIAAGEDVWSILIKDKEETADLQTAEGVQELLTLYSRAEADYLSIPLLQKHLQFLLDHHERYSTDETKPPELGDIFSTSWTRDLITEIVGKGINHLTKSNLLWDLQRDWELEQLASANAAERTSLADYIQVFFVKRLGQPHADSEETSQQYSTFTTNYRPPAMYESLLITASKARAQATKAFERREPFEIALRQSNHSLDQYARYLAYERRPRNPDLLIMRTVHERAITEADKRRYNGEAGAEDALRVFWVGYCDSLRINDAEPNIQQAVFKRAVRSVPGCGEIWARYIRFSERHPEEGGNEVPAIFEQALNTGLLQSNVEQIVPVVLARVDYERRRLDANPDDEEILPTLLAILENGIEMVHQAAKTGDVKLRLERYLAAIYETATIYESAITTLKSAAKFYKSSYIAWILYTDALIKYQQYEETRQVFTDIHTKKLDWPEAIWEAWIAFEHLHGSCEELETCLDKVEKAQYQVNLRRTKEAEKASLEAMNLAMETQPTSNQVAQVPISHIDVPMGDSFPQDHARGTKRGAEDESVADHKKPRLEQKPLPLKRDRENCTVFIGALPANATEEDLMGLFKDCGKVREVKITVLPNSLVASVEFFEQASVPMALTKDKKCLHDQEVDVHLAWRSTLYVTNFPEAMDDTSIRDLFGKYGTIFDVRWPSKKFKATRRFCYVQFTSPASAELALELHGHELEPNQPMNVLISNPERKKDRTDQDANEREVYVAGLSKFTNKIDLDKLFKMYGTIKEIRMATDDKGLSKGFAFVEFESEKDALAALDRNNYELKKRRIAVTLADSRARNRNSGPPVGSGFSKAADVRSRSVRIRNLPANTQEGLLQQILEKIAPIKRVELFLDKHEAVAELDSAAEAGQLLLRSEPIIFNGHTLTLSEEGRDGVPARPAAPPLKVGGLFVPRAAVSRPRAGLGHARRPVVPKTGTSGSLPSSQPPPTTSGGKGQDDFRKLLGGQ